jgi:hypothetical protein
MRHFTTAAVALALDVSPKWLDNLLSRRVLWPSSAVGKQGRERHLSPTAILAAALALDLHRGLNMPLRRAADVATDLVATRPAGKFAVASGVTLQVDLTRREADLQRQLASAAESAPRPPRGRPAGRGQRPRGA